MAKQLRALMRITIAILLSLCWQSCLSGQEDAINKFIEFVENQVAKDDAAREKNSNVGKGRVLNDELVTARVTGLKTAIALLGELGQADVELYPGIAALRKDLTAKGAMPDPKSKVTDWPALDVSSLTLKNPNFWQAYYEVQAGQGIIEALYCNLLKADGDCMRSLQTSVIARLGQRQTNRITLFHTKNAIQNQFVFEASNYRINQGIKAFEKQQYDQAAESFKSILAEWPKCGLASFELGLTYYYQKEQLAGREVKTSKLKKGDPALPSQRTYDLYKTARSHDPMIRNAYQGTGARQLVVMARLVLPAYQTFNNVAQNKIMPKPLGEFGTGCQAVGLQDYALFARQIFVSTKNQFDDGDVKFIQTSLASLIGADEANKITNGLKDRKSARFAFKNKKANQ